MRVKGCVYLLCDGNVSSRELREVSWSGAVLRLLALTCVCHVLSSALGFLCPCYVGVYISIVINGFGSFFLLIVRL